MDYRNESHVTADIRWNDRITYDGTGENNLFNFFVKVAQKLTEDLKKPFRLEGGVQRIDDTPVHKAVREGWVKPELIEDTNLNQVTLIMKMKKIEDENVIENVIENEKDKLKKRLPEFSEKRLIKALEIVKMIHDNPQTSIDEMCVSLKVTERTVARYISEMKEHKVLERVGPDKGGIWKVLL